MNNTKTRLEVPLKICRECGKTLPITDFNIDRSKNDGKQTICKECNKTKSKVFYRNNSEWFQSYKEENRSSILLKMRECNFLYGRKSRGGFLQGTGICVFCGEIDPFLLEIHHPFGPDHPFKIHECAGCHRLQHRFPAMLEVSL